jgi:hypothetical protein
MTMPGDPRINAMIEHIDRIVDLLACISSDAEQEIQSLNEQLGCDPHLIAFLQDLRKRSKALSDLLEEEAVSQLIGINNLLGPVDHLRRSLTNQGLNDI